jgi:UDP-N-acetylglucosamine/UDP-N-acetylgalactosamine diphosphorylase
MLRALNECGALDRLERRGVRYLFYGQVDNPLTQLCDPRTLGLHAMRGSEMTTQVVRKQDPLQRVGNVVTLDGRLHVIEYSDMPESIAVERDDAGRLRFWAGNIAVHVFDLAFLQRVKGLASALPFHRAIKRVAFVDAAGRRVDPAAPNAIKFERFIFDLLPHAERSIVVEIDPAEGFAAVKNAAEAATETIGTAQAAMIAQHKRWLEACGATVSSGVAVEIHPLFAVDPEQLRERLGSRRTFAGPTYLTPGLH